MSSFIIKIIALLAMLVDHTTKIIGSRFLLLYLIGRISFPLFAFQTTIGYAKTKNVNKYLLRLLIFALISEIPYQIFINQITERNDISLNIFFTICLGVICMYIYDLDIKKDFHREKRFLYNSLKVIVIFFIIVFAKYINVDYGIFGVFLILFIHILYNKNKILFSIGYIYLITIEYINSFFYIVPFNYFIAMLIGGYIPLIFMLLYNGKKGVGLKYLFYIFYPVHLTILVVINLIFLK